MIPEAPPTALIQPGQPAPEPPPTDAVHAVPPSPDQLRAADAVFAEHREHPVVAGLLGLWSGGMLLNDLAKEHFKQPEEDEEREKKEPKPKEE